MHEVALLLAIAAAASILARYLGIPLIPLLLLGGLGISAFGHVEEAFLQDTLILGVSFLLFVVGLELDPRRVRAQRRAALQVGLAQFVVLAGLGFGMARWLGFGPVEAGYVALALPASSTLVGVRLLQRRRQMFEPFGRLTLGSLLLQDILVLLAIPLVTDAALGLDAVAGGTAGVVLLTLSALAIRRWGSGLFLRVEDEPELILLGALSLLFVFIGGAALLGLPIVVGAFLAGMSLSRFPVNGIVRAEVSPIGDFFVAIFFTAPGDLVGLHDDIVVLGVLVAADDLVVGDLAVLGTGLLVADPVVAGLVELVQAAWFAGLVLVVTPPLVLFVAERAGFTATSAAEAGLLLAQTSEISLVVVLAGRIQGQVSESLFVVIAIVTLVTMLATPFLSTDAMARRIAGLQRRRRWYGAEGTSGHVLLLGAGSTGMPLLEDLVVSGCQVVVIDDDPLVTRRLNEAGIPALCGSASDPEVLRQAGVERARAISSTVRRPRDNRVLLEMAGDVPVLVRVFEEEDAEWIRAHGGEPIVYSHATADALLEWFELQREELELSLAGRVRD